MRHTHMVATFGAVVCLEGSVHAGVLGIISESFIGEGWVANGYERLTTYRVYAVFDLKNEDDGVLAVFGGEGEMPIGVTSPNGWFFNDQVESVTAPQDLTPFGYWSNQWDTYVTINATRAHENEVQLTPGFVERVNALCANWEAERAAWFVPFEVPQGLPDENGRVLLGQFTVVEGAGIELQLNLILRDRTRANEIVVCTAPEVPETAGVLSAGCPFVCLGDPNADGVVNNEDLITVLASWGPGNSRPADSDCDLDVDLEDLLVVLAAWGPCP